MKTLFDPTDNAEVVERIESLGAGSRAQWGKMDCAQMLAHCQNPLLVAMGELQLKRGLIGLVFGGLARRTLTGAEPFKRNMPTDPKFRVSDPRDLSREQAELVALVRRFGERGPEGLTRDPHPFFGPMTVEEWEALMWKHLDHHLRQFGA